MVLSSEWLSHSPITTFEVAMMYSVHHRRLRTLVCQYAMLCPFFCRDWIDTHLRD